MRKGLHILAAEKALQSVSMSSGRVARSGVNIKHQKAVKSVGQRDALSAERRWDPAHSGRAVDGLMPATISGRLPRVPSTYR